MRFVRAQEPDALAPDAPAPSAEQLHEEVLDLARKAMLAGLQLLVIDTGGLGWGAQRRYQSTPANMSNWKQSSNLVEWHRAAAARREARL